MKLVFDVLSADTTEASERDWQIPAKPGDTIQKVALAHLTNFASSFIGNLTEKIPTLGPADGAQKGPGHRRRRPARTARRHARPVSFAARRRKWAASTACS